MCNLLDSLDINPKIIDAARAANLNVHEEVLTLSIPELVRLTSLSEKEILILISAVSHAALKFNDVNGNVGNAYYASYPLKRINAFPSYCITFCPLFRAFSVNEFKNQAWQLCENRCPEAYQRMRISTGCKSIDSVLNGGIVTRTITEVAGESSCGKTQLCLQLSLKVQLPYEHGGLKSEVAYICTEQSFPINRFCEIAHSYQRKHIPFQHCNFLDGVFIAQIGDLESMWNYFKQDIPALLTGRNIKLIIIDSIAALFRCEPDIHDHNRRLQNVQKFGMQLQKLVNKYGVAILCVNQVTDVFENKTLLGMNSNVNPSLGLCWSNFVTTRLALSRPVHPIENSTLPIIRSFKVIFSPYLPSSECKFVITSDGVNELNS